MTFLDFRITKNTPRIMPPIDKGSSNVLRTKCDIPNAMLRRPRKMFVPLTFVDFVSLLTPGSGIVCFLSKLIENKIETSPIPINMILIITVERLICTRFTSLFVKNRINANPKIMFTNLPIIIFGFFNLNTL